MNVNRAAMRGVLLIVAALTLVISLQVAAMAEPWEPWRSGSDYDNFQVFVQPPITALPDGSGIWVYTAYVTRPGGYGWNQLGAFIVYPAGMGSFETYPPTSPNYKWRYGYAYTSDAKDTWLPNDPVWCGGGDPSVYLDSGFETTSNHDDAPTYTHAGAFGWRAAPAGGSWFSLPDGRRRTLQFEARLPGDASTWNQTRFGLRVRRDDTGLSSVIRGVRIDKRPGDQGVVPEPGTLALLATGAIGVLPLLRRRRKA